MNFSIYRISLDIHKTASQLSFSARQGDTSRRLYISLVENGAPYEISQECYAVFSARKPDGTVISNSCTIQDNMIIYDMTEQTTALTGRCECEVSLYGYDGEMISSPRFAYTVYPSVGTEDVVVSTDEVTSLRTLITEANGAIGRANNAAESAEDIVEEVQEKLDNGEFIGPKGDDGDTGTPGNSMVFRFSAHKDGTDFSTTWSPGMFYMGIASVPYGSPAPTDKSAYTWTMFATNIFDVIPVTLSASAWSGNKQVIEASLMSDSILIPSPADDDSTAAWMEGGVMLESASENSMTFVCVEAPTKDITANVLAVQSLIGVEAAESDVFVIRLNEDETALANTTWVDIGAALYSGKVLELRYKKGLKEYRSCEYVYVPAEASAGVTDTALLFFVPYATLGNGGTMPGIKVIKITYNGVTKQTTSFNMFM